MGCTLIVTHTNIISAPLAIALLKHAIVKIV